MQDLAIGKWILPQPDPKKYVPIPRLSRFIPFGYKVDEENKVVEIYSAWTHYE